MFLLRRDYWRRPPTGPVEIDLGHPLLKGVYAIFTHDRFRINGNLGPAFTVVGAEATSSSIGPRHHNAGIRAQIQDSSNYHTVAVPAPGATQPWTVAAVFWITQTPASGRHSQWIGISEDPGSGTHDRELVYDDGGKKAAGYLFDGAGSFVDSTLNPAIGEVMVASVGAQSTPVNLQTLWMNGSRFVRTPTTGAKTGYGGYANPNFSVGYAGLDTGNIACSIAMYFDNRWWSDADAQAWQDNPYQIYRAAGKLIFLGSASGDGVVTGSSQAAGDIQSSSQAAGVVSGASQAAGDLQASSQAAGVVNGTVVSAGALVGQSIAGGAGTLAGDASAAGNLQASSQAAGVVNGVVVSVGAIQSSFLANITAVVNGDGQASGNLIGAQQGGVTAPDLGGGLRRHKPAKYYEDENRIVNEYLDKVEQLARAKNAKAVVKVADQVRTELEEGSTPIVPVIAQRLMSTYASSPLADRLAELSRQAQAELEEAELERQDEEDILRLLSALH